MHGALTMMAVYTAGLLAPTATSSGVALVEEGSPVATTAAPATPEEDTELHWTWKNGLRLETADERYRFRMGGRVQLDAGWFSGDDLQAAGFGLPDGSEFRRARFYMSGELPGDYFFKAEYDFAGSVGGTDDRPAFTDVLIGKKDLVRSVDVTAGHFKEPFGLEQLASANNLTFLERGLPDALVPRRNDGVMLSDTYAGELGTWAVGGFRAMTDNAGFSSQDGGYAVTARATVAPLCDDDEDRVLHLGLDYSRRGVEGVRFRSRPEAHLVGNLVDTGTIDSEDVDLYGVELAGELGPFAAQAEYVMASTSGNAEADVQGWYVEGSWLLTGEHRPYSRRHGTFGRVVPMHSTADGGRGAWQLAARYSSLDLDDGALTGGRLDDVTVGVTWYLTANMKLQLDYVLASLDDGSIPVDAGASLLMMRLHMDW